MCLFLISPLKAGGRMPIFLRCPFLVHLVDNKFAHQKIVPYSIYFCKFRVFLRRVIFLQDSHLRFDDFLVICPKTNTFVSTLGLFIWMVGGVHFFFQFLNFFLLIRGILRIPNEIFSYFESSCRSILLCFSSLRRGSWRIPCRCTANSDYILGDTALRTHSSSRRYNPRGIYIIDDRTVAHAKYFYKISPRWTGSKRIPFRCTEYSDHINGDTAPHLARNCHLVDITHAGLISTITAQSA